MQPLGTMLRHCRVGLYPPHLWKLVVYYWIEGKRVWPGLHCNYAVHFQEEGVERILFCSDGYESLMAPHWQQGLLTLPSRSNLWFFLFRLSISDKSREQFHLFCVSKAYMTLTMAPSHQRPPENGLKEWTQQSGILTLWSISHTTLCVPVT